MVRVLAMLAMLLAAPLQAQEHHVAVPDDLAQTGLVDHLLPRFSLKTGLRLRMGGDAPVARLGDAGTPVIAGPDRIWSIETLAPEGERFADWLRSDVGKRTIAAFEDGRFAAPVAQPNTQAQAAETGDVTEGARLAMAHCGRCHVIDASNRMKGLGSTPSFAVLRTLPGWRGRFESFYAHNPHGAFTQVAEVTPPFDSRLPPPIAVLELTLDELAAITAYAATIPSADLGAPLQSR